MSLTNSSSWAPDESDAVLWLQRSWIIGDLIGAVAYGVHATLYFTTIALLWERRRTTPLFNIWIVFSTILFVLSSVGNACQFKLLQLGFADFRNYPGPPAGWESGNAFSIAAISLYVVSLWPQDALLMYRFRVIVGGSWCWMIIPAILFLANVGVGCTIIAEVTLPRLVIWATTSANLLTAYFSISVAFNIILTVSIVTKLVRTRRNIINVTTALAPYLSVSAMLIESAVIYSVFGLMLVVAAGIKSATLQNFVLPTLGQVQSIAPMLILMRVAQGRAWTTHTTEQATMQSSLVFRHTRDDEGGRAEYPLTSLMSTKVESSTTMKVNLDKSSASSADIV